MLLCHRWTHYPAGPCWITQVTYLGKTTFVFFKLLIIYFYLGLLSDIWFTSANLYSLAFVLFLKGNYCSGTTIEKPVGHKYKEGLSNFNFISLHVYEHSAYMYLNIPHVPLVPTVARKGSVGTDGFELPRGCWESTRFSRRAANHLSLHTHTHTHTHMQTPLFNSNFSFFSFSFINAWVSHNFPLAPSNIYGIKHQSPYQSMYGLNTQVFRVSRTCKEQYSWKCLQPGSFIVVWIHKHCLNIRQGSPE